MCVFQPRNHYLPVLLYSLINAKMGMLWMGVVENFHAQRRLIMYITPLLNLWSVLTPTGVCDAFYTFNFLLKIARSRKSSVANLKTNVNIKIKPCIKNSFGKSYHVVHEFRIIHALITNHQTTKSPFVITSARDSLPHNLRSLLKSSTSMISSINSGGLLVSTLQEWEIATSMNVRSDAHTHTRHG